MSTASYICHVCHEEIADLKGYLYVLYSEIAEYDRKNRDFTEKHTNDRGWLVIRGEELWEMPNKAPWRSAHNKCLNTSNDYWIEVSRARDVHQLFDWTLHLSEKNWLGSTNWFSMVRELGVIDREKGGGSND